MDSVASLELTDFEFIDNEALDLFQRETDRLKPQKVGDIHTPFGETDPGELPDPDRIRGAASRLTSQEKAYIYFWARRKAQWIENHSVCRCYNRCPYCKLCRCTSRPSGGCRKRIHRYERDFQCRCFLGWKHISPKVVRPLIIETEPPVL